MGKETGMEERAMTAEQVAAFQGYLREEERSAATQEKYLREVTRFFRSRGFVLKSPKNTLHGSSQAAAKITSKELGFRSCSG